MIKIWKPAKTKFGRWLYWQVWFTLWYIWRPRVLAKLYRIMTQIFLRILSKSKREELQKEFDSEMINEITKRQRIEL